MHENIRSDHVSRSKRYLEYVSCNLSIVIIFALFGSCADVLAADSLGTTNDRQSWVDMGMGLGGWRTDISFGTNLSFSFEDGSALYTLRYSRVFGLKFLGVGCEMSDYGFLYGLAAKSKYSWVAISGGLGVTVENYSRLGIPLEADAFATPIPWVGIGVKVCANVSPARGPSRNYCNFLVCLEIGKLR